MHNHRELGKNSSCEEEEENGQEEVNLQIEPLVEDVNEEDKSNNIEQLME